jgi:phage terminase large subunit-like protein
MADGAADGRIGEALDLVASFVLEDDRQWGDVAAPFQWEDVGAIFGTATLWHYLTRPRGGSKTTDLAAVCLGWLVIFAGAGARGYVVASDSDQAALLVDAAAGLVDRTPALRGAVTVESLKIKAASGATVEVLAADGASAFGRRPSFLVVDEFSQWAQTRNAKRVWSALLSSAHKVDGCRLVILTSAGEPSHFSMAVLKEARKSPERWHVHEVPGPLSWIEPEKLEAQRPLLRDSEFSRLHLNIWTASEDRLVTEEDLAAAAVLDGPLDPVPGRRYVCAVDLGLTNDKTVVVIAHAEPTSSEVGAPKRIVVDRLARWQGTRHNPVRLDSVEAFLVDAAERYHRAKVVLDPWQAAGIGQRLKQRGLVVVTWTFSATSVGHIASALHLALRNRIIHLPNDEDLLSELGNVRLKETTIPGMVRLDHDSGQHDDTAVALGLAIVDLQTAPAPPQVLFDESPGSGVFLDGRPLPHLVGPYAMAAEDAHFLSSLGDGT